MNPRLGGRGEEVTTEYTDGTEFVKLFLPEGEIDFVASSTLTENPFEEHEVLGRKVLLETPIEIVAKKYGTAETGQRRVICSISLW